MRIVHIVARLGRARVDYESWPKNPLTAVTPSSGNVFADIGVPEPEEKLAKARLASRIREIVLGKAPDSGRRICRDANRPTQGVGVAQQSAHELLQRAFDASLDQARSRCRGAAGLSTRVIPRAQG